MGGACGFDFLSPTQPLTVCAQTGLGWLLGHRPICEAPTGLASLPESLFVYPVFIIISSAAPPGPITPSLAIPCHLGPCTGAGGRRKKSEREKLHAGVKALGSSQALVPLRA